MRAQCRGGLRGGGAACGGLCWRARGGRCERGAERLSGVCGGAVRCGRARAERVCGRPMVVGARLARLGAASECATCEAHPRGACAFRLCRPLTAAGAGAITLTRVSTGGEAANPPAARARAFAPAARRARLAPAHPIPPLWWQPAVWLPCRPWLLARAGTWRHGRRPAAPAYMDSLGMPARRRRSRHAAVMVAWLQPPMYSVWMPARWPNAASVMVAWSQ